MTKLPFIQQAHSPDGTFETYVLFVNPRCHSSRDPGSTRDLLLPSILLSTESFFCAETTKHYDAERLVVLCKKYLQQVETIMDYHKSISYVTMFLKYWLELFYCYDMKYVVYLPEGIKIHQQPCNLCYRQRCCIYGRSLCECRSTTRRQHAPDGTCNCKWVFFVQECIPCKNSSVYFGSAPFF
jgi:hypothetical protein